DAEQTAAMVEAYGATCIPIQCDLKHPDCAREAVDVFRKAAGDEIHVLVNNAAAQWPEKDLEKISLQQLDETFRMNVYSYFLFTQEALPHMRAEAAIVNTTSVTAPRGSPHLVDDSMTTGATKGAIVAFTRSLAGSLLERKIRVNGVAPGPIWTPL